MPKDVNKSVVSLLDVNRLLYVPSTDASPVITRSQRRQYPQKNSYVADDVMVLREFRDRYLLTNAVPFGKQFVRLYYTYSPPIAGAIAKSPYLRAITRFALTPIIFSVEFPSLAGFTFMLAAGSLLVFRRRSQKERLHR